MKQEHIENTHMNHLIRALIEKLGHDQGFECVLPSNDEEVLLSSATHPATIAIIFSQNCFYASVKSGPNSLLPELKRNFTGNENSNFQLLTELELLNWIRRTAALAQSLPNQTIINYEKQVQSELALLPESETSSTEVQRLVRQRVGQQAYRTAMLNYWGSACAVSGVTIAAALRASHAKPWAECESDSERLDVFNGFLLSANLDALFDKFLVTFSDSGELMISSKVAENNRKALGLNESMTLRWIAKEHLSYLRYHRERFDR